MTLLGRSSLCAILAGLMALASYTVIAATTNPVVRITTTMGVIEIELDRKRAPITVENFIKYTNDGFYNGTVFHRVIPRFMIQGGGFKPALERKEPREPIKNEAGNGLKNLTGTIAMARTSDPHSATSQFFINTVDNGFLDKEQARDGWGYTVFGKVTKGMDVVKKIEAVPTGRVGPYGDVPTKDVVIEKVEVIRPKKN